MTAKARTLAGEAARLALLALLLGGAYGLHAMAERPQLFAERWYGRGGWARTIQVIATDSLGPGGTVVLAAALVAAYGVSLLLRAWRRGGPRGESRHRAAMRGALGLTTLAVVATAVAAGWAVVAPSASASSRQATEGRVDAARADAGGGDGRRAGRLDVLLLVAASLPADSVTPASMPAVTALATRGTRFENAYVTSFGGEALRALPARFAASGYATAAVDDGEPGHDVASRVRSALGAGSARPLFLTVTLGAARAPYRVPWPYYAEYTDPAYRGPFKYDASRLPAGAIDEADQRQLRALHEGAVAAVDDAIAQVLAEVRRAGFSDRTVVVLTSDHGERLLAPGRDRRGAEVGDDEVAHVPLVIVDPRGGEGGARELAMVRDVDLAPTLEALTARDAAAASDVRDDPRPDDAPRSLDPALRGEALTPRLAFATSAPDPRLGMAPSRMVRDERWKLVYVADRKGATYTLFDTVVDPAQRTDVAAQRPDQAARLKRALWTAMLRDPAVERRGDLLVPRAPALPYDVLWVALPPSPSPSLAARGVSFTQAHASATGARASTLSLLAGARPSELGLDTASSLLTIAARRRGMATVAFVDGDDLVVRDLGFERVERAQRSAAAWIADPRRPERSFTYVRMGASRAVTEAALAELLAALDRSGRRDHTLLVVTQETTDDTRLGLLLAAPGALPEGRVVDARVRAIDVAPTLDELLGLEPDARTSGRSLAALARGEREADERVVVTEGRGFCALLHGEQRLVVRDGPKGATSLFDLASDPRQTRDLSRAEPDRVAELRARLEAALANVPVAGSAAAVAAESGAAAAPVVHLRFASAGRPRRVAGTITVGTASRKAQSFTLERVGLGPDTLRLAAADRAEIALVTSATSLVGFDVRVDPPTVPIAWDLYLDDQAWPDDAFFAGPYGLVAPALRAGLEGDRERTLAASPLLPDVDPARELGLFVTRERAATRP